MFYKDPTRPLRFGELFSGVGGMSLGITRAGWECAFHAEWSDVPRAVLKARFPDVPLYADVSDLDGRALIERHGAIDLLHGSSPCQNLSIAGKREGLHGDRSVLFYEQMRLWDETGAPMCLWENVPGALTSNQGDDFASILSEFVGGAVAVPTKRNGKRGKWSRAGYVVGPTGVAAWRVLDAQFFGVAQRRRRVFVLGVRGAVCDPREVLALTEGSSGHSASRGAARKKAAVDSGSRVAADREAIGFYSTGGTHGLDACHELSPSLKVGSGLGIASPPAVVEVDTVAYDTTQITNPNNRSKPALGGPCHSLAADAHAPLIVKCVTGDITHTLTHEGHDASEDGTGRGQPIVARMLAFGHYTVDGTCSALKARDYKDATDLVIESFRGLISRPRRLTPLECERLQGWPDNHTLVQLPNGKWTSDAARYMACGNGVASPVADWIATQLGEELVRSGYAVSV